MARGVSIDASTELVLVSGRPGSARPRCSPRRSGKPPAQAPSERPHGTFSRQLFLGEGLDANGIQASYENGVLTVTVPVAEQAKPRKVEIASGGGTAKAIDAEATAA